MSERNISPDDLDLDELVERFRENNHIAPSKEDEYKESILSKYRKYYEEDRS